MGNIKGVNKLPIIKVMMRRNGRVGFHHLDISVNPTEVNCFKAVAKLLSAHCVTVWIMI